MPQRRKNDDAVDLPMPIEPVRPITHGFVEAATIGMKNGTRLREAQVVQSLQQAAEAEARHTTVATELSEEQAQRAAQAAEAAAVAQARDASLSDQRRACATAVQRAAELESAARYE